MKTLILLSLILFAAPVFGQEPAVIEPLKVAILTPEEKSADDEFRGYVLAELNKLRRVVFASSSERADLDVVLVVTPITTGEERRIIGYAAAVVVIAPEGKTRDRIKLWNETGPSLEEIARRAVKKMDAFFQGRHGFKYHQPDKPPVAGRDPGR